MTVTIKSATSKGLVYRRDFMCPKHYVTVDYGFPLDNSGIGVLHHVPDRKSGSV